VKTIRDFRGCTSLLRIEIPSSVEVIGYGGFLGCTSLEDILFSADSHVKEMYGFCGCTSLLWIEIPSSVEVIGYGGFLGCTSLNEILFSRDTHQKEPSGFRECASLRRIELSSSVEGVSGFRGCNILHVVVVHTGCRMLHNEGLRMTRPFLVHEDADVKASRRLFHLRTFSLR
jgi:hypothetical protein